MNVHSNVLGEVVKVVGSVTMNSLCNQYCGQTCKQIFNLRHLMHPGWNQSDNTLQVFHLFGLNINLTVNPYSIMPLALKEVMFVVDS